MACLGRSGICEFSVGMFRWYKLAAVEIKKVTVKRYDTRIVMGVRLSTTMS